MYYIGWTLKTIHAVLTNLWGEYLCASFYANIHAILEL